MPLATHSYTIYLLAKHPEVKAKMLKEIDAFCVDHDIDNISYDDVEELKYTENVSLAI